MKKYTLYLKTHKITGLKYLGYTTRDPFRYKGSGTYWLKHLFKHGNFIETKIVISLYNKQEIKRWAKYYSILWNVVESVEFANLIEESISGIIGYKHTKSTKIKISQKNKGKKLSLNTRKKISKARKGMIFTDEHKKNIGLASRGRPQSEETKRKRAEANKGQKRTEEFKKRLSLLQKGKTISEQHKKNMKIGQTGKKYPKIPCDVCGKLVANNRIKFHKRTHN